MGVLGVQGVEGVQGFGGFRRLRGFRGFRGFRGLDPVSLGSSTGYRSSRTQGPSIRKGESGHLVRQGRSTGWANQARPLDAWI